MIKYDYDIDIDDPDEMYKIAMSHRHISGYSGWKDLDLNYLFVTEGGAKMAGYKGVEDFIGTKLRDSDLRCPAVELTDQFAIEDNQVIEHRKPIRILEYMCYADDSWTVVFGEKFPIINSKDELIAIGLNAIDITHSNLAILNYESLCPHRRNSHPVKQFSYVIGNTYDGKTSLSNRQGEVLFYLLRGATAKSISERLNISIRTAEAHINSLKDKFNCSNKEMLIEKLVSHGYLNLIPDTCIFKT
jgi:DNA-binding CsgD family transcriptional regulator